MTECLKTASQAILGHFLSAANTLPDIGAFPKWLHFCNLIVYL